MEALIPSRMDASLVPTTYERLFGVRLDVKTYGYGSLREMLSDVPSLSLDTQVRRAAPRRAAPSPHAPRPTHLPYAPRPTRPSKGLASLRGSTPTRRLWWRQTAA